MMRTLHPLNVPMDISLPICSRAVFSMLSVKIFTSCPSIVFIIIAFYGCKDSAYMCRIEAYVMSVG